ncbi:MAG TPA: HAD-IIIA family hydrolase [Verrucomicrobiae bacterium]|nr:HAD-IIIA family hydrolase [Verrucomicrobiae bacterium]
MSTLSLSQLRPRLRRVKLFLCDVDGVLTDGSVFMGGGVEIKRFDIRDGLGLKLLQREGIKVGWISRRPSDATRARAENLKIDFLAQGDSGKIEAAERILRETQLNWADISYVGDDIVDVGILKRAGFAVAVGSGVAEAKSAAHYITKAEGGRGAIREVVEMILKAQNKWKRVVSDYAV